MDRQDRQDFLSLVLLGGIRSGKGLRGSGGSNRMETSRSRRPFPFPGKAGGVLCLTVKVSRLHH